MLYTHYVWPEANSSAAGVRNGNLIDLLHAQGAELTHASTAQPNAYSEALAQTGDVLQIQLNCDSFNSLLRERQYDLVLFDRYISEEQFGWRVRETLPDCLQVIDTQDLHFLRTARQKEISDEGAFVCTVPSENRLQSDVLWRELASLYRVDLALVLSDFEHDLLTQQLNFPAEKLFYLPIFAEPAAQVAEDNTRRNFVSLGNFRHPPNLDAVETLCRDLWPEINRHLPEAKLHCYGAYPVKKLQSMQTKGVEFCGPMPDLAALGDYRALIAPLRFGAGIKGKVLDAWRYGSPVVTTSVGAEGLRHRGAFGGLIADSRDDFIEACCSLYHDDSLRKELAGTASSILREKFHSELYAGPFLQQLQMLRADLQSHRRKNIIGQMLQYQGHRASEFFSRYLQLKAQKAGQTI